MMLTQSGIDLQGIDENVPDLHETMPGPTWVNAGSCKSHASAVHKKASRTSGDTRGEHTISLAKYQQHDFPRRLDILTHNHTIPKQHPPQCRFLHRHQRHLGLPDPALMAAELDLPVRVLNRRNNVNKPSNQPHLALLSPDL
jgi:hypothetical protein